MRAILLARREANSETSNTQLSLLQHAVRRQVWVLFAGQQIAQSAASEGASASAAVNEEEVRGPHASLAVRLQVCSISLSISVSPCPPPPLHFLHVGIAARQQLLSQSWQLSPLIKHVLSKKTFDG